MPADIDEVGDVKQLTILGLGETGCSLCLEPADGRKKPPGPVFVVAGDGTWSVCGPHLAALVKAAAGEKPTQPKPAEMRPAVQAALAAPAVPAGNGPPK